MTNSAKPVAPASAPAPQFDLPQLPVPQAQSTFLPADALSAYARSAGVPAADLGRLAVEPSASELWDAITAYLSYSPVPHGHPPVPLIVSRCNKIQDDDATAAAAATNGSADADADSTSVLDEFRARALGAAADGAFGKKVARPAFEIAPCTVDFLWPPPPHLRARAIVRKREKMPFANLHDVLLLAAEENGDADADSDAETELEGDANGRSSSPSSSSPLGEQQQTIRLFYYHVGAPVAMDYKMGVWHNMLLASPGGSRPLMRFSAEVLRWYQEVTKTPDLHLRFPLLRFKMCDDDGWWASEGLKRARPVDSVVLASGLMERILADIGKFRSVATRVWYFRHGLPYRRSYLFYGPPGTGKTSTMRVIASKFKLSCCSLSVANQKFSNQALGDALSKISHNSLLVLEDVDALFNEDRSNKMENQLTFSGMLNALDGLGSVEGLITIMTTNHIDRLEKALIRGGRVDRRFRFDHPNESQLQKLFKSFYPDADRALCARFASAVRERPEGDEARAVSTLQQLFIEMRECTAKECVEGIDDFFKMHFPDGAQPKSVMYAM